MRFFFNFFFMATDGQVKNLIAGIGFIHCPLYRQNIPKLIKKKLKVAVFFLFAIWHLKTRSLLNLEGKQSNEAWEASSIFEKNYHSDSVFVQPNCLHTCRHAL